MARALVAALVLCSCLLAAAASSTPVTLSTVLAKLHPEGLKQFNAFTSTEQQAILVEMNTLGMHEQDIDTIRFGPGGMVRAGSSA